MSNMTLNEEIKNLQKEMMPNIPEETVKVMMGAMEKLVASGIADNGLKAGDTAPPFSLPNLNGETVSSAELLKKGPLVINFYRGGWCPYCNLELRAFQRALPEIKNLGAELVSISPELADKTIPALEKHSLDFEVLSDVGNVVAKEYGLIFTLPEELRPVYKGFGIDIPASNGDDSYEIPIPATYIVKGDGTIASGFVDADYTKRMEPSEVIEALKKLR